MEPVTDILIRLLEHAPFAQVFSVEDPDGTQHHWNATLGRELAEQSGCLKRLDIVGSGLTPAFLREHYLGLDEAYALTTDTSQPILLIPHNGKDQLIDGWHRLVRHDC